MINKKESSSEIDVKNSKEKEPATFKSVIKKIEDKLEIGNDGKLEMNDLVSLLMKCEGAKIDRAEFLQKALSGTFPQETIDVAIKTTPLAAGIKAEELSGIVTDIIEHSRDELGLKAAFKDARDELVNDDDNSDSDDSQQNAENNDGNGVKELIGKVGGAVEAITSSRLMEALLTSVQKFMYLYGFQQTTITENGTIRGKRTRTAMILCFAVMSKVRGADEALKAMAQLALNIPDEEDIKNEEIENEEIKEIMKKWRQSFFGEKIVMSLFDKNPITGIAADKLSAAIVGDKNLERLAGVLSDTVLSNAGHVPSSKELELAEEVLKQHR